MTACPAGLVLINTGNGKGKTTAALGTAIRAWGNGQRILIFQFIKGAWKYGELEAIHAMQAINGNIEIRPMGDGFVYHNKNQNDEAEYKRKQALAAQAWEALKKEVNSDSWDLIVLDEINYAVHFNLIDVKDVEELLRNRPRRLNVILTGRYARPELIELADTVTEMKIIRHAYQKGIRARKGIEF